MFEFPIPAKLKSLVSKKLAVAAGATGLSLAALSPEHAVKVMCLYIIVQGVVDVAERVASAISQRG